MDTVVDGGKAGRRAGKEDAPARSGQSGEGARSAFEHLIQQERKRDAQLPREDAAAEPARPRRA